MYHLSEFLKGICKPDLQLCPKSTSFFCLPLFQPSIRISIARPRVNRTVPLGLTSGVELHRWKDEQKCTSCVIVQILAPTMSSPDLQHIGTIIFCCPCQSPKFISHGPNPSINRKVVLKTILRIRIVSAIRNSA